jgi:hypothetical protein
MRYEYLATAPDLPPPDERRPSMRNSPMMSDEEMTAWFNRMDELGWEFVGYGQKQWNSRTPQEWWVFRKPRTASVKEVPCG